MATRDVVRYAIALACSAASSYARGVPPPVTLARAWGAVATSWPQACSLGPQALSGPRSFAQSPSFGLGRAPRAEELRAIDIEVLPDGRGLPPGSGTAEAGQLMYATRCALCHGATGKEGPQDVLVGGQGTLNSSKPLKTVGSYWPYATTLWDYVSRAMPFDHPGSLPADQVYATTAYLLHINGIIGERDVMDQTTLPRVKMPNRTGFVADTRPDVGQTQRTQRTPRAQKTDRR